MRNSKSSKTQFLNDDIQRAIFVSICYHKNIIMPVAHPKISLHCNCEDIYLHTRTTEMEISQNDFCKFRSSCGIPIYWCCRGRFLWEPFPRGAEMEATRQRPQELLVLLVSPAGWDFVRQAELVQEKTPFGKCRETKLSWSSIRAHRNLEGMQHRNPGKARVAKAAKGAILMEK